MGNANKSDQTKLQSGLILLNPKIKICEGILFNAQNVKPKIKGADKNHKIKKK